MSGIDDLRAAIVWVAEDDIDITGVPTPSTQRLIDAFNAIPDVEPITLPDEDEDDDVVVEMVENPDPHRRFQMYTREGNEAVALMVAGVIETAEKYALSLPAIKTLLHNEVAKVEKVHPEIHDTEPRGAILDAMDRFLDRHGYKRLEFLP